MARDGGDPRRPAVTAHRRSGPPRRSRRRRTGGARRPRLPGEAARRCSAAAASWSPTGDRPDAPLGVLGRTRRPVMDARLRRAAAPFRRPGAPLRSDLRAHRAIADGSPDGRRLQPHDIRAPRVGAASGGAPPPRAAPARPATGPHRLPGRGEAVGLGTARPWVEAGAGPRWRMGRQVPARTIGRVSRPPRSAAPRAGSDLTRRARLRREALMVPASSASTWSEADRRSRAPTRARDGAARRRVRHAAAEAGDVPIRPAAAVPRWA